MKQTTGRGTAGALLIVLGFGLFLFQFVGTMGGSVTLVALGGLFLFFYFTQKSFGYLVPGCILTGIGFGEISYRSDLFAGDFSGVGLGLGFIAIFVIRLLYERVNTWWPLIPGIILLVNGLGRTSDRIGTLLSIVWPLFFVLLGVWVLLRKPRKMNSTVAEDAGRESGENSP